MNIGFVRPSGSGALSHSARKAIQKLETAKRRYDESDESERELVESERIVAECILAIHHRVWRPGSPPAAVRLGDTTYVAIGDEYDSFPRLLTSKEVAL